MPDNPTQASVLSRRTVDTAPEPIDGGDRSPRAAERAPGRQPVSVTALDPVLRIVARTPVHVLLDTTLRNVAQTLAEESIGVVLVWGPEGPAGIVSERDVTAALAEGADPGRERAQDRMTTDLAFIAATDTIAAAANRMLANEIRHLVVTAGSTTIGIVSMRDVLAVFVDQTRQEETT